jgi:hypothetical protein
MISSLRLSVKFFSPRVFFLTPFAIFLQAPLRLLRLCRSFRLAEIPTLHAGICDMFALANPIAVRIKQ